MSDKGISKPDCPLKLNVCYPSCYWWDEKGCTFNKTAELYPLKVAVIDTEELGNNCWLPCRFIQEDGRCCRVWTCTYPEKKHCKAVIAEIKNLLVEKERISRLSKNLDNQIRVLIKLLKKSANENQS